MKPLFSHVSDLRKMVLQIICILIFGTASLFYFSSDLLHLITGPYNETAGFQRLEWKRIINSKNSAQTYFLSENSQVMELHKGALRNNSFSLEPGGYADVKTALKNNLALFSPAEGLLLCLKLSFWISFFGLVPLWLIPVWNFIKPGLYTNEKKLVLPFLFVSFSLVTAGFFTATKVTLPLTNRYFFDINENLGQNFWGLSNYVDYWITLTTGHMFAFELLAIAFFLIELNIVTYQHLKGKRRYQIVLALIIGAILTPPDIMSQLMLALPLMGFYELALIWAKRKERVRKRGHSYRADPKGPSTLRPNG